MKRSCGCPYIHTNPNNLVTKDVNMEKGKLKRKIGDPRAPLKNITNSEKHKKAATNENVTQLKEGALTKPTQCTGTQTSFKVHIEPRVEIVPETIITQYREIQEQISNNLTASSFESLPTSSTYQRELVEPTSRSAQSNYSNIPITLDTLDNLRSFRLGATRHYSTPNIHVRNSTSSSGFISATKFFNDQLKTKLTPAELLNSNEQSAGSLIEYHLPPRKKTLLRPRGARSNEPTYFISRESTDIYNLEYIDDILNLLHKKDRQFLITRKRSISKNDRNEILKWIISAEDELGISLPVYFTVTRFFDYITQIQVIPRKSLQLVAAVLCLLIIKVQEVKVPKVSKVLRYCGNIYNLQQYVAMEMQLLFSLDFNLNIPTPCDFANMILYAAKIPHQHKIVYSVYYIMEVFSTNIYFSTYTACEIASAAFHLTTQYFTLNIVDIVQYTCLIKYNFVDDIVFLMNKEIALIRRMSRNSLHGSIYNKYLSQDYLRVSEELDTIVNSK